MDGQMALSTRKTEVVEVKSIKRPEYQRPLNEAKVCRIVQGWDAERWRMPILNRREDGTLVVIDGQHTLAAWALLGEPVIECEIRELRTLEEESDLWLALNTQGTMPRPADRHRSLVISGDPVAVEIEDAIQYAGLVAGNTMQDGKRPIEGMRGLRELHAWDSDAMRRGLALAPLHIRSGHLTVQHVGMFAYLIRAKWRGARQRAEDLAFDIIAQTPPHMTHDAESWRVWVEMKCSKESRRTRELLERIDQDNELPRQVRESLRHAEAFRLFGVTAGFQRIPAVPRLPS